MNEVQHDRISIQVSLSGYSFKLEDARGSRSSAWQEPRTLFTSQELQRTYEEVELSVFTPKCALVPEKFFTEESARGLLAETVQLDAGDVVSRTQVPQYAAVLLYSSDSSHGLCEAVLNSVRCSGGSKPEFLPEMYYMLRDLSLIQEYNKILASWADGWLYLTVAQGRNLQLANVFRAADFTTAEYYIFNALKSLQLNPEMSCISFRTPLAAEQEMSLYRYFRSVEKI